MVDEQLRVRFYGRPSVRDALAEIEAAVMNGELSATMGAQRILNLPDTPGE